MGKKLIIKGADFSENGMLESTVVTDGSTLKTIGGTVVTSENIGSLTKADTMYFYVKTNVATPVIDAAASYPYKIFSNRISVDGYDKVEISLKSTNVGAVGNIGFMFSFAFIGAQYSDIIKVYTSYSGASGLPEGVIEYLDEPVVNREYNIPNGAKYICISDLVASASDLDEHEVNLIKYVVE